MKKPKIVTVVQLTELSAPGIRRFELGSGTTPGYVALLQTLETIESCQAEDRKRARALRKLNENKWAKLYSAGPAFLADLLESGCSLGNFEPSRASAICMREVRARFLGSTLDFLEGCSGISPEWVTAVHPAWQFGPEDHNAWQDAAVSVPRQFRSMLRIAGVMTAPGFLIMYLHTQLDPGTSKFMLQFRGIAEGKKLTSLRQLSRSLMDQDNELAVWDHIGTPPEWTARITVASRPIKNLRDKITWMMPSFISKAEQVDDENLTDLCSASAIPQPFGSAYLMWLDEHVYEQIVVMSGVAIEDERIVRIST